MRQSLELILDERGLLMTYAYGGAHDKGLRGPPNHLLDYQIIKKAEPFNYDGRGIVCLNPLSIKVTSMESESQNAPSIKLFCFAGDFSTRAICSVSSCV